MTEKQTCFVTVVPTVDQSVQVDLSPSPRANDQRRTSSPHAEAKSAPAGRNDGLRRDDSSYQFTVVVRT
jgi:hypothetical protein